MDIQNILSRTNLKIPFDEFLKVVQIYYPQIGDIKKYTPIYDGYEDANVILDTNIGKYVLKVFAFDLIEKNIFDLAKVISEAHKVGVKTIEIERGKQGLISKYENTYFMLTKFFEGKSFFNTTPSLSDIISVTESIAKLNTLDFEIELAYDSWEGKNLIAEFEKNLVKDSRVVSEIKSFIDRLNDLDMKGFSKSVIHGDIQKKHVLKSGEKLCILDYGCASYDYKVFDLSTLLAWFALDTQNWDMRNEILQTVIQTYTKYNSLNQNEINSLKVLITASYAAYYLKTTQLIEEGDNSIQTKEWNEESRVMYFKSLEWLIA